MVVGLVLRVASGTGGAPWSFALVATLFLGLVIVGWRCAVAVALFGVAGLQRLSQDAARRNARR